MKIGHLDESSPGYPYDSYSLGVPVSPASEAVAYGTLVDHGVQHNQRSVLGVTSADGGSLFTAPTAAGRRVMPAKIADEVTGVMRQVVDEGTGTAARQAFPVYGKTGTTDDFTNAWFTGCTRTLCISVWMGYDKQSLPNRKPHSMLNVEGQPEVFGGTLPAEIFAKTWSDYRALQHPASATPTPTPAAAATRTLSPAPRSRPASASARPTPSSVKPAPTQEPPTPTPPPTPTLIPPATEPTPP
jgi:membrane peptidoglycan carboxypeptidase